MKKIVCLLTIVFLLTTGCSVENIDISKIETIESSVREPIVLPDDDTVSNDNIASEATKPVPMIPYSEVPETAELGEKFCVIGPVNSGHLYLTINRCEVFDSLNDAGMEFDDLMRSLISDGFNYDANTTKFLKGFKMIKVYMTVENVDAVSYDHIYEPDIYDKYDFSMGRIGGIPYATGEYFDLRSDDGNFFKLHIEPGEKKKIIIGYLLDTRQVKLEDAVFCNGDEVNTPDEIPYTVVDLELGGESS